MIVIVGAGPTGLALGYWLQQAGVRFHIVEQHTVGATWAHQYQRLHLHTLKELSALPGLPMPADYPRFPSARQVYTYLHHYADHFQLPISCGVRVERVTSTAQGWLLHTTIGMVRADQLVLATGIWHAPATPTIPGLDTFGGQVVPANHYYRAPDYAGQRVLVVGVGNSGAEIAADLGAAGIETGIVVRSGSSFVAYPASPPMMAGLAWLARTAPQSFIQWAIGSLRRDFADVGLPQHPDAPLGLLPVVGYELPQAAAAGTVTVYPAIERVLPDAVQFSDGRTTPFDTIVLATGYQPALPDLPPALIPRNADGTLHVPDGRTPHSPSLYLAGYTYPTTEGFLQSLPRRTRALARELAA